MENEVIKQLDTTQKAVLARVYAFILGLPDADDNSAETPANGTTTTQPHNSETESEVQR